MKILVATDFVLYHKNGHYYLPSSSGAVIERYFQVFGKMILFSRVRVEAPSDKYIIVDEYIERSIPDTLMSALLKKDKKILIETISNCDLVIGRCPSMIAYNALSLARKLGKPTFAEVMGDAWDAYWNHSLKGKLLAPYMYFAAKKNIKNANYTLYVTNEFLQKRYPCKNESIGASNVKIDTIENSALDKRLEKIKNTDYSKITLVTTAAVNVRFKGQQYVIKAIPKLNKLGIRVNYALIGDGDQSYLKNLAKKLNVSDQVEFAGFLTLQEIYQRIDNADIYIQPSLQEGLPRSVIEAMSRACPCIGARTAGIPELISPECVVKRKSVNDIVKTVSAIFNSEKLNHLSCINFDKSKEYSNDVLSDRRNEFYNTIKEQIHSHDKY